MGARGSKGDEKDLKAKATSQELEQELNKEHTIEQKTYKILLLGTGESGKTTIWKQMFMVYGRGFTDTERDEYKSVISLNVLGAAKVLCEQADKLISKGTKVENITAKRFIEDVNVNSLIDEKISTQLANLWSDPGIQATYELRAMYQLDDSTGYYLSKIKVIGTEGYRPTEQDVLRSRIRTTGIIERRLTMDGHDFLVMDVGGQRNERKKWIHSFGGVISILFVTALSEYDQVLYEDEDVNRMTESINLFDQTCNNKVFKGKTIIIFLNKRDIFQEKIKKVPLTKCFPDYTGPNTFEDASKYILDQFLSRNHDKEKQIFSHLTCATDTENTKVIFNAVKDTVIKRSLQEAGLIT